MSSSIEPPDRKVKEYYHKIKEKDQKLASKGKSKPKTLSPKDEDSAIGFVAKNIIAYNQRRLKKKLMEAVEKYGYHQSQLARYLAVHRSTISRWLREYENAIKET